MNFEVEQFLDKYLDKKVEQMSSLDILLGLMGIHFGGNQTYSRRPFIYFFKLENK